MAEAGVVQMRNALLASLPTSLQTGRCWAFRHKFRTQTFRPRRLAVRWRHRAESWVVMPAIVRASLQDALDTSQLGGDAEQSMDSDTIAAIVTGAQQGAVSIIRISGDAAVGIAQQVFRQAGKKGGQAFQPDSHRVYYGKAYESDGSTIDEVLLLCMLGPRSYTAEDVIEIHTHGGGVCAQRVLRRCVEAGARLSRPGEFTLRAFLNGRLDLSQAESVSQLIEARTVAAADSALAGLAGGLGREVQEMRAECIDLLTEMDVRLDFDEDLPPLDVDALARRIEALSQRVQRTLSTARQGQLLRTGLQVALVGRPNVGKSSLLNALSGTERAIVTEIAGTTRDIVEAGVVIGGIPITLLDTAGLRQSSDKVERIGVERSLAAAKHADIVVMVMDAQAGWTVGDREIFQAVFQADGGLSEEESFNPYLSGDSYDSRGSDSEADAKDGTGALLPVPATAAAGRAPALLLVNKVDLAPGSGGDGSIIGGSSGSIIGSSGSSATNMKKPYDPHAWGYSHESRGSDSEGSGSERGGAAGAQTAQVLGEAEGPAMVPRDVAQHFSSVVCTSAATGQGLGALREAVLGLAGAPQLAPGGMAWAVNERQAEALIRAQQALARVGASVAEGLPVDFWTIDLREAVMALGEVSGEDVTEEVLDRIFSKFCIGK